ncbi:hypothetical protein [Candidatus Enterococcus ferrettii]|uniref:Uncharacterized protein n=1 Tax=Candidatus Enterococcus ferrettii TaxID=2815324 RepID=A0ABV0ENQ7_9ENTE|nr:hypothetical protein [Enterococcus sp. 665A]
MERYGWMIILAVIGMIALLSFFIFLIKDMQLIKQQKRSRWSLSLNVSLLIISALCIILAVYFYMDIQDQISILEKI